ncbi:MAG: hypothetical protein MJ179_06510 [Treponema sp.]|nr:hypothetical protein [Treponema sp.]
MLGEDTIKVLAEGLSCYPVCYKESQFNDGDVDSFNLELRNNHPVNCFDIDDMAMIYRTRNFQLYYTTHIMEVVEYLNSVLCLAMDICEGVQESINNTKRIARNKNLNKDAKDYQTAKTTFITYFDIIQEIKTRIDDLSNSPLSHNTKASFDDLLSMIKTLISTSYVPDEAAESINQILPKQTFQKFKDAHKQGLSEKDLVSGCMLLNDKIFNLGLKPFLLSLMNEFSFYITSDQFLNNPSMQTVLVVPLSLYKKFNFKNSGLLQSETVVLESNKIGKTVENFMIFYEDLYVSLNHFYERAKILKSELQQKEDKNEIEWVITKYEALNNGKTGGLIPAIKVLTADPAFREKFTRLMYELRPGIVKQLMDNENPWANQFETSKDLKKLDKETTFFVSNLIDHYFKEEHIPTLRLQMVNFLRIFSYCQRPEKSFTRFCDQFNTGKQTWNTKYGMNFKKVLDL